MGKMAIDPQVVNVRDKSISWLMANLKKIQLPAARDYSHGGVSAKYDPVKALGELALLCRILKRIRGAPIHAVFLETAQHLNTQRAEAISGVRETDSFLYCLRLSMVLEVCGADPAMYLPSLARTFSAYFSDTNRWDKWNILELKYYLDILGISPVPDFELPFHLLLTTTKHDNLAMDLPDVYRMTHAIFCASDFGRLDLALTHEEHVDEARYRIGELLTCFIRQGDWDVVAELVTCCTCIGYRPEPIYKVAWKCLADAQSISGAIPAQHSGKKDDLIGSTANLGYDADFAFHYHTTIVAFIASVLELSLPHNSEPVRTANLRVR